MFFCLLFKNEICQTYAKRIMDFHINKIDICWSNIDKVTYFEYCICSFVLKQDLS